MLTATTLALPSRTNIPRPTKKNPKDTPNRVFNKLAWHQNYGTEGVVLTAPLTAPKWPSLFLYPGTFHLENTTQRPPLPTTTTMESAQVKQYMLVSRTEQRSEMLIGTVGLRQFLFWNTGRAWCFRVPCWGTREIENRDQQEIQDDKSNGI